MQLDRSSSLVWMTHSHCVRKNFPQRSWVQIPSGPLLLLYRTPFFDDDLSVWHCTNIAPSCIDEFFCIICCDDSLSCVFQLPSNSWTLDSWSCVNVPIFDLICSSSLSAIKSRSRNSSLLLKASRISVTRTSGNIPSLSCTLPLQSTLLSFRTNKSTKDTRLWINKDTTAHIVTSGTFQGDPDGILNSGILEGESFTYKPKQSQVGKNSYY